MSERVTGEQIGTYEPPTTATENQDFRGMAAAIEEADKRDAAPTESPESVEPEVLIPEATEEEIEEVDDASDLPKEAEMTPAELDMQVKNEEALNEEDAERIKDEQAALAEAIAPEGSRPEDVELIQEAAKKNWAQKVMGVPYGAIARQIFSKETGKSVLTGAVGSAPISAAMKVGLRVALGLRVTTTLGTAGIGALAGAGTAVARKYIGMGLERRDYRITQERLQSDDEDELEKIVQRVEVGGLRGQRIFGLNKMNRLDALKLIAERKAELEKTGIKDDPYQRIINVEQRLMENKTKLEKMHGYDKFKEYIALVQESDAEGESEKVKNRREQLEVELAKATGRKLTATQVGLAALAGAAGGAFGATIGHSLTAHIENWAGDLGNYVGNAFHHGTTTIPAKGLDLSKLSEQVAGMKVGLTPGAQTPAPGISSAHIEAAHLPGMSTDHISSLDTSSATKGPDLTKLSAEIGSMKVGVTPDTSVPGVSGEHFAAIDASHITSQDTPVDASHLASHTTSIDAATSHATTGSPEDLKVKGTVWGTVKSFFKSKGINADNDFLNKEVRGISAANHIGIAADHPAAGSYNVLDTKIADGTTLHGTDHLMNDYLQHIQHGGLHQASGMHVRGPVEIAKSFGISAADYKSVDAHHTTVGQAIGWIANASKGGHPVDLGEHLSQMSPDEIEMNMPVDEFLKQRAAPVEELFNQIQASIHQSVTSDSVMNTIHEDMAALAANPDLHATTADTVAGSASTHLVSPGPSLHDSIPSHVEIPHSGHDKLEFIGVVTASVLGAGLVGNALRKRYGGEDEKAEAPKKTRKKATKSKAASVLEEPAAPVATTVEPSTVAESVSVASPVEPEEAPKEAAVTPEPVVVEKAKPLSPEEIAKLPIEQQKIMLLRNLLDNKVFTKKEFSDAEILVRNDQYGTLFQRLLHKWKITSKNPKVREAVINSAMMMKNFGPKANAEYEKFQKAIAPEPAPVSTPNPTTT